MPLDDILARPAEVIPSGKPLLFICNVGQTSAVATQMARALNVDRGVQHGRRHDRVGRGRLRNRGTARRALSADITWKALRPCSPSSKFNATAAICCCPKLGRPGRRRFWMPRCWRSARAVLGLPRPLLSGRRRGRHAGRGGLRYRRPFEPAAADPASRRPRWHAQDGVGGSDTLTGLNPDVSVVRHDEPLTSDNALEILEPYDIVVNGCDNFPNAVSRE